MIPLLILFPMLSIVEFEPSNVHIEYSYVSDTEVSIALAINSLCKEQNIIIKDENLIGNNGVKYPVDLSITAEPTLTVDVPVKKTHPFVPSKIIQMEDMLCGSTTLNSPCVGKKTLCCVDLYKGVNYFRCHSPADVSYRRYEWGDISSAIGFTIRVKGISGQKEYKLLNPDNELIVENKDLRLHFSSQADSHVEEVLSTFQGNAIIQTSDSSDSEPLDDLRILFAEDTFTFTEDEWFDGSSCYSEIDKEFDLVHDSIKLSRIVGKEYSGSLSNSVIHLQGNLDMILYLTISASK